MIFKKIIQTTKGVNALLCEKDKEALYRYASKVKDGGVIVDIGTAAGGSAFIMALASKPTVSIITIDPGANPDFLKNKKLFGLTKKIRFINKTSEAAFKSWDKRKIDMLFIDGIHSHYGVMNDFETWGSFVKKDGIIAIHDIFLYDTIGMAVKELINIHKLKPIETVDDIWKEEKRIGMLISRPYYP